MTTHALITKNGRIKYATIYDGDPPVLGCELVDASSKSTVKERNIAIRKVAYDHDSWIPRKGKDADAAFEYDLRNGGKSVYYRNVEEYENLPFKRLDRQNCRSAK